MLSPEGIWILRWEREPESGEKLHINSKECGVGDLWIFRHGELERQYVLLRLNPRPVVFYKTGTFPISGERYCEKTGYYEGHYITEEELYDGFANINGEVVRLTYFENWERNQSVDFIWLAPQMSMYIHEAEMVLREVYQSLVDAGEISAALLEPLEHVPREEWRSL
jgi:hypothetical protein